MKYLVFGCFYLWASFAAAQDADNIVVRGLLKNMAVLEINGVQRTLKAGKTSPEGVKLISANAKQAVVEVAGETKTLKLSKQIGGVVYETPEKTEVRIASGSGGHYFTPGRINNRPVRFLVDTGATAVVMNSIVAKRLGIDYLKGRRVSASTASGRTIAYVVNLQNVSVGNVVVHNVSAMINEGAFPEKVLLGNTYLSRVEMIFEQGVLVLQAKF